MVLTERIAVAVLTVFLRSVFRKLPFLQAPIIENSSSNYFISPQFVVAGGVFYYVTRNRCRSWIDRFRTRPNLRPPAIDEASGEVNQTSENRIEKAASWLESNYRTSMIPQSTQRCVINQYTQVNFPPKIEFLRKTRKYRRRNKNYIRIKKIKYPIKRKEEGIDPQPSTSGSVNTLPSYQFDPQPSTSGSVNTLPSYQFEGEGILENRDYPRIFPTLRINDSPPRELSREKEETLYPKSISHSDIHSVKTAKPRFSTTLKSENEAPEETPSLNGNLFGAGCSGDHQVLAPICKICRKKKQRKHLSSTSENTQFNHMGIIKGTGREVIIPPNNGYQLIRTTRSGKIYAWPKKTHKEMI